MASRLLCPRLALVRILCVLTFIILTASSAVTTAQSPLRLGIPSLDPNDGRFLAIAGSNVGTLANVKIVLYVGAPAGETSLHIGIFDGDVGGNWDYVKPGESPSCTYTIYPDPTKSGTTFDAPIALNDSMMLNDGWFIHTIQLSDSSPAKNTSSGNYFFRIEVEFVGSNSLNAFKIGTSGQPSLAAGIGQMGFIASPSPLEKPVSPYDGKWTFYPYAHPDLPSASFWDGDADSADDEMLSIDLTKRDDSSYRGFRVSPNIYYVLTVPSGTQYPNFNPSGDNEWEEFTLSGDSLPAGFYSWEWFGVDHGNLVFIRSDLEIFMTTESPLNGEPDGGSTPQLICGRVTGNSIRTAGNGRGGFTVQCDNSGVVKGELQFQNNVTNFHAHQIEWMTVSGKIAEFSGVGEDGRHFHVYVEDNGESGINDVFRIAIDGESQIGSGTVTKGNIQIHK